MAAPKPPAVGSVDPPIPHCPYCGKISSALSIAGRMGEPRCDGWCRERASSLSDPVAPLASSPRTEAECEAIATDSEGREQRCAFTLATHNKYQHRSASGLYWPIEPGDRAYTPTAEAPLASAPEQMAMRFHEAYERLAPSFGYETRPASAKPWADVPENNRRLMIAVCAEVFQSDRVWAKAADVTIGELEAELAAERLARETAEQDRENYAALVKLVQEVNGSLRLLPLVGHETPQDVFNGMYAILDRLARWLIDTSHYPGRPAPRPVPPHTPGFRAPHPETRHE